MQTPAQKHRLEKLAAKQQPENGNRPDMSGYELMMAQLYQHKRQLKTIKSVQAKGLKKREILGEYIPYIKGALEADSGNSDEVLMTWLAWSIDAHELDLALTLGEYGLRHGLEMPDQFMRSIDSVLVEEICDIELKDPEAKFANIDQLQRLYQLVNHYDMHDQIRSKLHKVLGLKLELEWPQAALEHLTQAVKFNERAGVKQVIARINKALTAEEKPDDLSVKPESDVKPESKAKPAKDKPAKPPAKNSDSKES